MKPAGLRRDRTGREETRQSINARRGPGRIGRGRVRRNLCESGRIYELLSWRAILPAWRVASPQRPLLTLERLANDTNLSSVARHSGILLSSSGIET